MCSPGAEPEPFFPNQTAPLASSPLQKIKAGNENVFFSMLNPNNVQEEDPHWQQNHGQQEGGMGSLPQCPAKRVWSPPLEQSFSPMSPWASPGNLVAALGPRCPLPYIKG